MITQIEEKYLKLCDDKKIQCLWNIWEDGEEDESDYRYAALAPYSFRGSIREGYTEKTIYTFCYREGRNTKEDLDSFQKRAVWLPSLSQLIKKIKKCVDVTDILFIYNGNMVNLEIQIGEEGTIIACYGESEEIACVKLLKSIFMQ